MALPASFLGEHVETASDLPKHVPKRDLCQQCGHGILKQEMYYGEALVSYEELKQKIECYIDYNNNNERIKQKLAGISSAQYRAHASQLAA